MIRRKVTGPDGRRWKLGRKWLPRFKRIDKADVTDFGPDLPGFDGLDDLGIVGVIIAAVLAVIVAIFLALLLFNVIALAIELTILIMLTITGLIGRILFRKPWIVFAVTRDSGAYGEVVGWRASRQWLRDAETRIASGLNPAPGDRGRLDD
jgi:hypothetical protein